MVYNDDFMEIENSGVPAEAGKGTVTPSRVAILEQSAILNRSVDPIASEGAKTQEGKNEVAPVEEPNNKETIPADANKGAKPAETDDAEKAPSEDEGKADPFHTHPAWKRLQRQNSQLKAQNEVLTKQGSNIVKMLEQLAPALNAIGQHNLGKEYRPVEVEKFESPMNFDVALESEVEALVSTLATAESAVILSDSDQEEILDIANKYASVAEGGIKIPLTAVQAYTIFRDLKDSGSRTPAKADGGQEPKKSVPNTRPDRGGSKIDEQGLGKVQLNYRRGAGLQEIVARAASMHKAINA